ncbi:MAG TPA: TonB-dependent receptor [Mucilaginibacter sp.]|nr:TonB-dependent receptor [Mucilaginibacter sp.]
MRNLTLAVIMLCLCALSSFSQSTHSIRGVTVDTVKKNKVPATVIVLNAKDSILVKYTSSATDGSFAINGLPAGNFLLMVTHPDYTMFTKNFTVSTATPEYNFGEIKIGVVPKMLNTVTIKGDVAAIKIKGDTIEYNAKAYVIQPNDRVEDLLRQIPGITVDKDGHITAQGEKVQKVLVDGEEFFGDDPTLVTKNIRADMVDKLQLYDAKSEQAKFTGIDDGVKIKTINVQLKEDRKSGVFGKADAGIGNDGYYEGQLIYNKFKPKEKFALYGTASNDGKIGLGNEDNNKVGASDVQINDNGSTSVSFGYDQLDESNYGGVGLPESKTGGVHLDDKWNKDKESINANYKVGSLVLTTDQTQLTQTTIGTNDLNITNRDSHSYNSTFRQKLDATYTDILSPTANLKLRINATDRHIDVTSHDHSVVTDGNNALLTTATIDQDSKDRTKILNADMFYTKRFTKPGRTLSWDVNEVYSHDFKTNYFKSDRLTSVDTVVNQYKPNTINSLVINSNITYSEPITTGFAVTINYGLALMNNLQDLQSYNQSASGTYNVLDSLNSNKYKVNQVTNQLGVIFNYRWDNTKKVLTFGSRANDVTFKQINEYANNTLTRDYINWRPQVTFRNRISQAESYNINYTGNSIQPGINQLQPIVTNTNPLYVTIGNPNLEPQFQHNFNFNYNNNQNLTSRFFNINGNLSLLENPIVNNTITDNTGKSTTQYVNLDHTRINYRLYANLNSKLATGAQAGLSLSTNATIGYLYNNGVLTKSNITNYNINANISLYKAKAYDFYLSGGPSFNNNQSSPHLITDNNSVGFNTYIFTHLFLPGKFQIGSDFDDNYTGKTQALPSINRAMLNASLNKSFFSGDNLKLSVSCNNILNQDQNYRYASLNSITQSSYNTIGRYFMFTVTWDFTKFGTAPAKK